MQHAVLLQPTAEAIACKSAINAREDAIVAVLAGIMDVAAVHEATAALRAIRKDMEVQQREPVRAREITGA